jgi:RNA polymerase sigma factor (sigma-70 family)
MSMSRTPLSGFTWAEIAIVSGKGMSLMAVMLRRLVGCLRRWADPSGGPTDRQLLGRFAAERDEDAFAELVRRHAPMVLGVARRVLHDAHDAEDVSQAVFLVLARKAASVRWRDSVGGWLFPVVYRLALKVRGGRERRRAREVQADPEAAVTPSAERTLELREVLDEELGRLPDHYRNVLVLCYLEGRSQKEAAEQLGLSADEVRGRLDRARQRLRDRLTRRGLAVSAGGLAALTAPRLLAEASPETIANTTRAAVGFAARTAAASSKAAALARGVLSTMRNFKAKVLFLGALALGALAAVALSRPAPAMCDDPARPAKVKADDRADDKAPKPEKKAEGRKGKRAVIVLWMSGGPSQIDTFDPKPGDPNGGPFKEIDTTAKGVKFSETLPKLAKVADQLAVIRSLSSNEASHMRGAYLMRTGREAGGATLFPPLTALLAKELSGGKLDAPPYVSIGGDGDAGGTGFLAAEFAPLVVKDAGEDLGPRLPPLEAFQMLNKDRAEAMRKAVEKAFDLDEEKKAVRDEYGRNAFGKGCLLARRLVEAGVPAVEVTLGGWDGHNKNFDLVKNRCEVLDPGWAALIRDLKERKLLDNTVVVWMGEFGRTPRINANDGRDHWARCFSVVLAGGGIKGGQAIGKTSADGMDIDERPVTPAELHATIYRALGVDPAKEYTMSSGETFPFVEKDTKEVKEALRP